MKKLFITLSTLFLSATLLQAQSDTMYVMKAGQVIHKQSIKQADVDSIIFYKPVVENPASSIQTVLIPAGMFIMGSPLSELYRGEDETQYPVTLSAFRMSKYEITNAQYAAFLNAKGIDLFGKYASGAYPDEVLIYRNTSFGLIYSGSQWVPVAGYENNPVTDVTWYGATEYATYIGGTLPTEAQWEYACRAGSTTPFSTGNCLTNNDANYDWAYPHYPCTNTVSASPNSTHAVGSFAPNAWGLYDMHGNVHEWCSDWYGTYPTTAQTNPKGADSGTKRVYRGGGLTVSADYCRSAYRCSDNRSSIGFRVVLAP